MPRIDYEYEHTSCAGGINEQEELASLHQCSEALNVWAPGGEVEARPGYLGVVSITDNDTSTSLGTITILKEDPIGTFTATTTLSDLPVGSRWYLSFTTLVDVAANPVGLNVSVPAQPNSNDVSTKIEYWNGTTWVLLSHRPPANKSLSITGKNAYAFAWPEDMASTTIDSTSGYVFRFTLNPINGGLAYDANVVMGTFSTNARVPTSGYRIDFFLKAEFPYTKRYIRGATVPGSTLTVDSSSALTDVDSVTLTSTTDLPNVNEPASIAVIPQFEEVYVAYDRKALVAKAYPVSGDSLFALVESDPSIIGPGAPYDPAEIAQIATWPAAKYIAFFRNELWAANLDDNGDYSIRWSAPAPNYRVWPSLNIEVLMEDDNSPITGLRGFDQHMVVFKNDSIWRMVDAGTSDFGLQTYAPERVVAGVGCVSNSSIQQIQGMLVFLSEDGVYGFDGVQATKLTLDKQTGADRLKDTIARITPGRRPFAAAAHWRKHNMYLLAVSLDGSDANNYVIAWDYKNDSWWLWNNIEARTWVADEDAADDEKLYFVDFAGRVYEFGVGKTDHGATINSSFTTQRLARGPLSKRLRTVEIASSNKTRGLTVELQSDDEVSGSSGALSLTDTSEKEYGAAVYSTDSYVANRRRRRRLMFNRKAEWAKAKISHASKNVPMKVSDIALGYVHIGRRR